MKHKLRVHYFQHIAGEGFGSCYDFLKHNGAIITATEFFALPPDTVLDIDALPYIDDVDLLIIMGGRMSVHDEHAYPWLKIEKRWLRRYLAQKKPAIGLCLGGQLIANVLGGQVALSRQYEVGWVDVSKVQSLGESYFKFPEQIQVISWHKEYFEIPKGAIQLASSRHCLNQAFQLGSNVLAFQFHPEITPDVLKLFIDDEVDLDRGILIQKDADIFEREVSQGNFLAGNKLVEQAISFVMRD